jgi:hypothetical protein
MTTPLASTPTTPARSAGATLLDAGRLAGVGTAAFRNAVPYPWLGMDGPLTDTGYDRLRADLPPLEFMDRSFGRQRSHGQKPHDRYVLEYRPDLDVAASWHQFVRELEGDVYRDWLTRLFGVRRFHLNFHWHYTPTGCSVSPHCDARHKLGSHIFYFNTDQDWHSDWGGETLVLDDGGRFSRNSAPDFDEFAASYSTPTLGNRSLLFQRQGNSWHGVRPIRCPEDRLRKVFIVVINADDLLSRLRRRLK